MALALATERLQKTVEGTGEALPKLDASMRKLWEHFGDGNTKVADTAKQLDELKKKANEANKELSDLGAVWEEVSKKFPLGGTALGQLITKIGELGAAAAGAISGGGGGATTGSGGGASGSW